MGLNFAVKVRDCQTAEEVITNRKVVLARIRAWKAPEKPCLVEIVQEVEQEVVTLAQHVEPATVPPSDVESVEKIKYPTLAQIMDAVCRRRNGASKLDMVSGRRDKTINVPRQIVMYLARHLTPQTLPQIGRALGGRDHTTILHGVRKIEALRAEDSLLNAELIELESQLGAG
jgi:hypothetical protein